MSVDSTTVLSSDGGGRESVRISSKKTFTHGLFIADVQHMPGNECGVVSISSGLSCLIVLWRCGMLGCLEALSGVELRGVLNWRFIC